MDEPRANKHPEFLQETMFEEHGTRVLITNPAADKYLDQYSREEQERKRKQNAEHERWLGNND